MKQAEVTRKRSVSEYQSNCCGASVDVEAELCLACFEHCGVDVIYEDENMEKTGKK